jgi:hypothetical protein
MSDNNITDLPTSNAPDVPPKTVDVPPSVARVPEGGKAHNLSKTIAKAAPSASSDTGKHKELRIEPRIRVKWHADAFIDGQGVYQGFVKDISSRGTDIFVDRNLQKVKFIKLRIYVPPLSKASDPHVMEVSGKVTYTAYDSKECLFHTGVNFVEFNSESDLAYLQSRIATINRIFGT